ncbi:MAG: DUF4347 domain-containing protein [Cyanobacteria bacterium P01_G01_bin.54]
MASLLVPPPTVAQSITAAPDGTGTLIHYNGNTYEITGGTQAGANLFHSFQQFGLQPNEIVDFLSNPEIQNVIGRVVGGDPSIIEGLIRLSGGNANLFLMNPAGWVFTAGASLDVPGSFGVTTANRMGFGEAFFNATGENDYAALTGAPSSLIFDNSQPGAIINATDLNLSNGSLWLVGGSVVSTGSITAPHGTVTVAAVPGESKVKLSHDGMTLSFFLEALAIDEIQPGTPVGIRAVDLPTYLNGSHAVGNANEIVRTETGELWLVGSGLRVEAGDVVIGDRVTAENVNLIASGRVQVSDPGDIGGDATVVRLPDASGQMTLTLIDSRVDNPEALLYGGAAGTIAQIIDRHADGIAVISEQLTTIGEAGEKVNAVSITAEGHEGNFWLGNAWITSERINDYGDQLVAWRDALTESADLLLYSCFTALGETGTALMNALANLTQADVATSVNATGSANYGGDWHLERHIGTIEVGNPFTPETLSTWEGKLATLTVTHFGDSGAGTLRQRIETDAAAGDMITFASAGTITLTSGDIDWSTNNLTLDGQGGIVDGNGGDRIFDITATTSTIQNLTIRNGSVTNEGGGIRMADNTTLTLLNSTLSGNTADNKGGGIYFRDNGTLILSDSTVSGNVALVGDGGGLSFQDNAQLTIQSSTITNNTAVGNSGGDHGGGIYTQANATVTLTDTVISGNVAGRGDGGGIRLDSGSVLTIVNSVVSGNSSGDNGGGIYFHDNNTLTVNNSVISNNSATGDGGGINFEQNGTLTLNNSTISNNSAGNTNADQGGGIYFRNTGIATVTNSTIANNSAGSNGGGIYFLDDGTANLRNVTMSSNTAGENGGGLHFNSNATLTTTNATIAVNVSGNNGGGIYVNTGNNTLNNTIIANNSASTAGSDLSGTFTANYSLILNPSNATLSGSNNIINQDPLLQPLVLNGGTTQTHAIPVNSPALNAGSNALVNLAGLTTDQRGLAVRIFGGTVDIGAYELDPNVGLSPFSFAALYIDPLENTEELVDGLVLARSCQTLPDLELAKDDAEASELSAEDFDATDGIDLDENCLPIHDPRHSHSLPGSAW